MIPDISSALSWLEGKPHILKGICRGIERETLRVNANGTMAQTSHPKSLGAALTHKFITTDFAEALLELVTPMDNDLDHMLILLRDIHRYVTRHLDSERMWPLSMPCFIDSTKPIEVAQYGNSNLGRMKTLYREGLKNRYSALMQLIAGVHYNFSLPLSFWQSCFGITDEISGKEVISAGYLRLIRNYYRFGWIIPYLFGASPGICQSFITDRHTNLPFEESPSGMVYLPYATSLRLSDIGYTNKLQNQLNITFNSLDEYICKLKQAIKTPSIDYQRIGLQKDGHYLQLNTNVLQLENELYSLIRPKRVTYGDESPSDALLRGGIEYIEVRSLDINPFSPTGLDEEQARFLDLFLIWCTLAEAPTMSDKELFFARINWHCVILEGRRPGLMLIVDCDSSTEQPLTYISKLLFSDLQRVAETLDSNNGDSQYQQVCNQLVAGFDQPELTLSARLLEQMKKYGIGELGLFLANKYRHMLSQEPLEVLNESFLDDEQLYSWQRQHALELADTRSFEEFLMSYNN